MKVDAIPGDGRLGKGAEAGLVRRDRAARRRSCARCSSAPTAPRDGVRVAVDGGPTLRFGAPIRLAAKWAAAARVLADTPAAGAESLDLRIPERPSAAYGEGEAGAEQAAAAADTAALQAAAGAVQTPAATFDAAPANGPTGAPARRDSVASSRGSRVASLHLARGQWLAARRATELVQNIAGTGNLTYRAESRRTRQVGQISTLT